MPQVEVPGPAKCGQRGVEKQSQESEVTYTHKPLSSSKWGVVGVAAGPLDEEPYQLPLYQTPPHHNLIIVVARKIPAALCIPEGLEPARDRFWGELALYIYIYKPKTKGKEKVASPKPPHRQR